MSIDYKKSGVDIDAGNRLVNLIKPLAKSTQRLGSNTDLGGFGALFDLKKCNYQDPVLVSSTDGVGTKLKIAIETNRHETIGIDLVAMSVNDLIVQGAEPLFFLDYFACSKLKVETAQKVISGIAEGCKQANCALIGGETAEMPDMYHGDDYDLAGFAVGAVERDLILPKTTKKGDVLLGLASSGVHSNGYSMVRYILKQNSLTFNNIAYNQLSFAEVLLTPTKIYVMAILNALKTKKIKALAHITGGGLIENLPRVLSPNLEAKIDYQAWQMPEIFKLLQDLGKVSDLEMRRTFNCGIGMVVVVAKEDANEISELLKNNNQQVYQIGELA
jgi:phosphoribosylformylglycinamidine cyclo-ligase